jgi:hypothetical protein
MIENMIDIIRMDMRRIDWKYAADKLEICGG